MATYEIKTQVPAENGLSLCTIVVSFGEGDDAKRFEQVVYLPDAELEAKAQEYADDYETQFTANAE